ncbi:MAG: class III signal peptide-containing protein [Candidatus Diapherotrites archaeon]
MNSKAQAALEYLLLLGAAVLLAAIVVVVLGGLADPTKNAATNKLNQFLNQI